MVVIIGNTLAGLIFVGRSNGLSYKIAVIGSNPIPALIGRVAQLDRAAVHIIPFRLYIHKLTGRWFSVTFDSNIIRIPVRLRIVGEWRRLQPV